MNFFYLIKVLLFYAPLRCGKLPKIAAILVHHQVLRSMGLVAAVTSLAGNDNTSHTSLVSLKVR